MVSDIKENNLTPLEIYMNMAFKTLIVIIPSIALCAGTTFTVLHLLGFYPDVSMTAMVFFDITCVIYTLTGLTFNRKCEDENGNLKPRALMKGKIFIAMSEFIQWNFISYMIPSRDFWAYSFFFVLSASAFLDSKFVLIITSEIVGSMFLSWIIRPEFLLPVKDALFIPEMALRFVLIALCFATIYFLVLTIEKNLVKELENISDVDTLTLLYNRRKLNKYLDSAAEQKKESGGLSVIMTDIDDFKNVNDTYGHDCGDEVLKSVANVMRNAVGDRGIVFRYGGEEMLALIYSDENEAFSIAEEIREKVENYSTVYNGNPINVTLTLGVSQYSDTDTNESMIKRADSNMYYGKSHGKNCVIK